MKLGDTIELVWFFESDAGVAQSYATAAAFTSAGWAPSWEAMDGTAVTAPSYTMTVDTSIPGRHKMIFGIPSVPSNLKLQAPTGYRSDPVEWPLIYARTDTDSVVNIITASVGTPAAQDRVTIYDWETTENDAFFKEMIVPTTALTDWGYSDLSAAGWSASSAARLAGDTSTGVPLYVMTAEITDTVNHKVGIGWGTFPTAAALTTTDLSNGSRRDNYDVQIKKTESFAITAAVAGANGTLTISGDKRKYFSVNTGSTFAVDTGANAGTYTPTVITYSGGNTILTVASLPSGVVAGNVTVTLIITTLRGGLTIKRQEDRS
jgi:hypothetical protein